MYDLATRSRRNCVLQHNLPLFRVLTYNHARRLLHDEASCIVSSTLPAILVKTCSMTENMSKVIRSQF